MRGQQMSPIVNCSAELQVQGMQHMKGLQHVSGMLERIAVAVLLYVLLVQLALSLLMVEGRYSSSIVLDASSPTVSCSKP